MRLYNANAAFTTTITTAQPSGSYALTIPALGAADTIATLKLANTFSGANTFQNAATTLGVASTTTGTLIMYNSSSANALTLSTAAQTNGAFTLTIPALTAADTVATLKQGNTFTTAQTISPTASLTLGTAGSALGQVIFNNATSGTTTLQAIAGVALTGTASLPLYTGGLGPVLNCGNTGSGNQTCSIVAANGKQQIYDGESTLSGNSATITFPNTFTSTTSYFCVANDVTTRANPVQMVPASGTTATITNTTGASDVIQWICVGN